MARKYIYLCAAFLAVSNVLYARSETKELKVMSYNIRMGTAEDGDNSWEYRAHATIEMLNDVLPDVFGVQEAYEFQLNYITSNCRKYKWVGVGRDDGKDMGEFMSVFWNKKRIKCLRWGTFWLSETPEVPSMGWDAHCKRTATWALMKVKSTGEYFYFVNTHLDHKGENAKRNGLKLIIERIDDINPYGFPMVLTGDFNITPENPVLAELAQHMDSARLVATKSDHHWTYNGWGTSVKKDRIIDYIYLKGFSECPEYQTIRKVYDNRQYVSDHYPIMARIVF